MLPWAAGIQVSNGCPKKTWKVPCTSAGHALVWWVDWMIRRLALKQAGLCASWAVRYFQIRSVSHITCNNNRNIHFGTLKDNMVCSNIQYHMIVPGFRQTQKLSSAEPVGPGFTLAGISGYSTIIWWPSFWQGRFGLHSLVNFHFQFSIQLHFSWWSLCNLTCTLLRCFRIPRCGCTWCHPLQAGCRWAFQVGLNCLMFHVSFV